MRQRNSLGHSPDGNSYAVVHCTGYIKNWPPTGVQMERIESEDGHSTNNCCLVAIGRLQVTSTPNTSDLMGSNSNNEFISRHSMDGKITFVDQRVTGILGYQPQELLGKTCFDYFHPEDQNHMKESFEQGQFNTTHTPLSVTQLYISFSSLLFQYLNSKVKSCQSCIDFVERTAIGFGSERVALLFLIPIQMMSNSLFAPILRPSI